MFSASAARTKPGTLAPTERKEDWENFHDYPLLELITYTSLASQVLCLIVPRHPDVVIDIFVMHGTVSLGKIHHRLNLGEAAYQEFQASSRDFV